MNRVVLVGYLARQVSVEQHRGGHLVGRTLLVVPRARTGRARGADFVPVVIDGRDKAVAAVELVAGDRVWVLGRLAATYADACVDRYVIVAREVVPVGDGPCDHVLPAIGRRGRVEAAPQAAESLSRVARAGRRQSARLTRACVDVGDPAGAQRHPSTRRPILKVLPGQTGPDVRELAPVLDRDDLDVPGVRASGRVSPRRRCP